MFKNKGVLIILVAIAANFLLGFGFNFYHFSWFDVVLHFLGGLGVYLVLSSYFQKDLVNLSWLHRTILLVGTTAMVGIIWEFAEYSFTVIPAILPLPWDGFSFIGDLPDTLSDLSLDILGGLFGSILYLHSLRKRKTK